METIPANEDLSGSPRGPKIFGWNEPLLALTTLPPLV
jgi:hypothetical protein